MQRPLAGARLLPPRHPVQNDDSQPQQQSFTERMGIAFVEFAPDVLQGITTAVIAASFSFSMFTHSCLLGTSILPRFIVCNPLVAVIFSAAAALFADQVLVNNNENVVHKRATYAGMGAIVGLCIAYYVAGAAITWDVLSTYNRE